MAVDGHNQQNRRPIVVLVDANGQSAEYLEAVLDRAGFECICCDEWQEALDRIQSEGAQAVVVEPDGIGLEPADMVAAVRANEATSHLVIIVVEKPENIARLRRAVEAGADDYLLRPFQPEELGMRISMRLRQRTTCWHLDDQEALLDLTRMLASSLDSRHLLYLVAVRTAEVLGVDRCSMLLIDEDERHATVLAATEGREIGGIRVDVSNYPEIQEVITTRRPFVVERVEDNPKLRSILPVLATKGVGSLALFPMLDGERVSGVLFLRSERFKRALNERDIFFANSVAAAVALSLRNLEVLQKQKEIAAEFERTKNFLEALIDSSVDAIVAADLKGNIILYNKGAERIFGYRADEVIGKMHVTKLYPPGGAQEVMALLRRAAADQYRLKPIRKDVLNKNGQTVPIQLTAWGVMENGKLIATAGIFTDLRERLQIERQLSQAQEKLLLTERQAMIAELAGATAHELNQPLTSVMGYAELARRKRDQPHEVERILDIILSETERMADIVRKIGRITKYETKSYVGGQRIVDIDKSSE